MQAISTIFHSHWMYLAVLLTSLTGLVILDWKYRLVIWSNPKQAGWSTPQARALRATLGIMISLFVMWDISGVILGIFSTNARFTIGLNLVTPNLPIEEIIFLILLTYVALLTYMAADRIASQRGMS